MKLELRARHPIVDSRLRQLCDRYLFYALGRFEEHGSAACSCGSRT